MNSKEWRDWINAAVAKRDGPVTVGPLRELCADLEAAERQAAALEEDKRQLLAANEAWHLRVSQFGTEREALIDERESAERRAAALEKAFIAVRDELVNLQPHIAQLDKAARPFIDAHVDKASRVINAVLVSTKEGE